MAEFIKDLKSYLITQSIGSSSTIFLNFLPDTPDTCITISEYNSEDKTIIAVRYIQILYRSLVYETARAGALAIKDLLSNSNPEQHITISSVPYIFKALQLPVFAGRDEKNRIKFTCNYRVI
jgi:hypothetical protein